MDERVERLKTADECEKFANNVADRLPELALAARRKAVELRAEGHHAATVVEREALQAVYAYEKVLAAKRGKNVRASRTWQMIKRHGIIVAVERAVNRPQTTVGYDALVSMGMQDMAFESVVCRHPEFFSAEAVERSRVRLREWERLGGREGEMRR